MRALELGRERPLFVGVVHLPPTPGSPRFVGDPEAVLASARADAGALAEGGCDGVLVENFGDAPFFPDRVPPETVASLALALAAVRAEVGDLPVGVNVLRNDARSALGLCAVTGASFFRVNVHTGSAASDQGVLTGRAAETLRERARLAPGVQLLADVHVKHATPLGGGDVADAAEDTLRRGLADALILSGVGTGRPVDAAELAAVRERIGSAPLLIGSGLTPENAVEVLASADGAIVGTWLKREGRLREAVDPNRVARMRAVLDDAG